MIIRILRTVLVGAGLLALIVFSPNQVLFSTEQVKPDMRTVSAKDLSITCSGPVYLAGGSTGTSVSSFKRSGTSAISQSYSGATGTTFISGQGTRTTGYGVRQNTADRFKTAASITVQDSTGTVDQGSQLLAVNQLQLITNKSIKGLLGAPCLRARSEFWLVGGSAATGREALLVLTNPSQVDATVDLEIYTENGISHSAGLTGIAVSAGKTTVLPLAAFVFRADSLAVHVLSHGGSITALIQQKAVRGLSAAGADFISPTIPSATESVIPGILVRGAADSAKLRNANDKYLDVQQMLRVFVPGNQDANLTFEVIGTDAKTFGTVISVSAPAGKVSDFKVTGLADGDYVGFVKSNVPVFSSFRLVRSKFASGAFTDFAWINPAESFSSPRYVAIPAAGISKLSLVNPGSTPTRVSLQIGSMTIKHLIAGGAELVVQAPAGQSVGIYPSDQPIQANLTVDIAGRITTLPVLDEKNIGGKVQVSVF
jgi:hypothetical protein